MVYVTACEQKWRCWNSWTLRTHSQSWRTKDWSAGFRAVEATRQRWIRQGMMSVLLVCAALLLNSILSLFMPSIAFSALTLLKSIQSVKIEWWSIGVVSCLAKSADCFSMGQLMPLHPGTQWSLASFKSKLVLPFRYWLTQVVLEKRSLNGCSSSSSSSFMPSNLCWLSSLLSKLGLLVYWIIQYVNYRLLLLLNLVTFSLFFMFILS